MCMIDGGEGWDFCKVTMRTARKVHRCGECSRAIQPLERYEVIAGKSEGEFRTYKTCVHCMAARTWLTVECDGSILSAVLDDLKEHWGQSSEYKSVWLARAIVGMRRKWTRKDGTLMEVPAPYVRREREA